MTSLTENLSELTDRCREVRLRRDDAATRAQLEGAAHLLDTRAEDLRGWVGVARAIRARDQQQLENVLVAAADSLAGRMPSGEEQPMELMRSLTELEGQFAEIESTLKEAIAARRRDLNEQVSRTRLLAENLREVEVVQACVAARDAVAAYFDGLPAITVGFGNVTDNIAVVRAARRQLIEGLGEHASGVEDFLNQASSANGFPLKDLTSDLLEALVERGLASGLRVKPA